MNSEYRMSNFEVNVQDEGWYNEAYGVKEDYL